jgi:hypothetical protein
LGYKTRSYPPVNAVSYFVIAINYQVPVGLSATNSCWIAGRRHACLGGSIESHKNKDSLYGRKSLESGRIEQIVYKYMASPTVRSIDFIIPMHHSKRSIPQADRNSGCR